MAIWYDVAIMRRILLALLVPFVAASAFAKPKPAKKVTFVSPCECQGQHGVDRWKPKTDLTSPPLIGLTIPTITPSQIYQWKGPGPNVTTAGPVVGGAQVAAT